MLDAVAVVVQVPVDVRSRRPEARDRLSFTVFVQRRERYELCLASAVSANRTHGFRVPENFERLDDCFHPLSGYDVRDGLIVPSNAHRLALLCLFQKLRKPALCLAHGIRRFHEVYI